MLKDSCLRCGRGKRSEHDAYCVSCLVSYKAYFGRFPHLTAETYEWIQSHPVVIEDGAA